MMPETLKASLYLINYHNFKLAANFAILQESSSESYLGRAVETWLAPVTVSVDKYDTDKIAHVNLSVVFMRLAECDLTYI